MTKVFLSGLDHAEFLRRHWQKRPLVGRAALRQFADSITRAQLFELARREDAESRVIIRSRGRWQVQHGPFTARSLARLPATGWTLLVQGVDQLLPQASQLMGEFSFIPYARLDDVMASYAAPGGGVGPHFDSYDVFLVQTTGRRRWQVSHQRDLELVPEAPLKLMRRFTAQRTWHLDPGDVLYLPPRWAHDGVAVDECITCSVGFRAPEARELGGRFLEFLQDRIELEGIYGDPGLVPARRPARIPTALIDHAVQTLEGLRWDRAIVAQFLGSYLTEPKAQVVFSRPQRVLAPGRFVSRMQREGVRLATKTRMLFRGGRIFINGEALRMGAAAARTLAAFADARALEPRAKLDTEARRLLYEWYRAGYIEFDGAPGPQRKPARRSLRRGTTT